MRASSNKLRIAAAAGVSVVMLAAAAVWYAQSPTSKARGEVAKKVASSPPRRAHQLGKDGPVVYDADALLADGSREAWGQIATLYPSLEEDKKRKVVEHIGRVPEFKRVVAYLLATVGEDPRPPSAEPLVAETNALLKSRLRKPEDFEHARQTMVMQKTDKRRWLLASALADFAKGLPEASPFYPLKSGLEAKLIDLHSQVHDPFVKTAIVNNVHALGSRDAALILTKGTNVRDDELEAVRGESAAVNAVLGNTPR